jgi:hypothetical protein
VSDANRTGDVYFTFRWSPQPAAVFMGIANIVAAYC